MVSQHGGDGSTSLALRGPSTVVGVGGSAERNHNHRTASSHVSSRSRRYGRSHAGGSAFVPQNEFPIFSHSGDVEIVVRVASGHENRYLLHRHTLTRCSGFFEASTSVEWSRAQTIPETAGAIEPPGAAAPATALPNSIFGGPSSRHGHGHSKSSSFFRSVANLTLSPPAPSQPESDLLRDYDNLFRIMYNYPPHLDAINIADAYVQCKSLLVLGDQYDALAVVGPRVDHHLLQFQSRLWRQIAKYPISYLRLGYLARSRIIFQEALIHVVGQWPAGERSLRAALPDAVLDLIEDKVDELEEAVSRVEARLFRLTLVNPRSGERVTPQNNYLDWLAVSLFRQWLAENTTPPPPPPPPPPTRSRHHGGGHHRPRGGSASDSSSASASNTTTTPAPQPAALASLGRTFRILGGDPTPTTTTTAKGGGGYLGHDECKRFLKLTPDLYSRDNLRRFEKRVEELKGMAREVVRPLMGSGLELEVVAPVASGRGEKGHPGGEGGGAVGYLTCVRVGERDWPWGE
ncbi:hypothetical protein B0T18DRAFT_432254 [Schizothecium vesticola]|uniref:BTB domain-containing protein n=1 Tax=Schizothecium vesticola TaxID=314040 RepID=A0AA40EKP9_9PEZI|nr:hypothetical protein B0T18DRAFT_432254 [Schizothecium vesticola]